MVLVTDVPVASVKVIPCKEETPDTASAPICALAAVSVPVTSSDDPVPFRKESVEAYRLVLVVLVPVAFVQVMLVGFREEMSRVSNSAVVAYR